MYRNNRIKNFLVAIAGLNVALAITWAPGLSGFPPTTPSASQIASGDTTTPNFAQDIVAKAFDRTTGTFYVATGSSDGNWTISSAARNATAFTGLTASPNFFNTNAVAANFVNTRSPNGLLGVINAPDINNPIVVAMDIDSFEDMSDVVRTFMVSTPGTMNASSTLKTANNLPITPAGPTTTLRLATGVQRNAPSFAPVNGKVFVHVYPSGGNDGNQYSGVCSLNVNLATGALTAPNLQAVQLDVTSQILNNGGATPASGALLEDLYWDEEIQVLYASLFVTSDNGGARQVCGLVKATCAADGTLGSFTRADGLAVGQGPSQVPDPGANSSAGGIFAVGSNGIWDSGAPMVRINKVRTMRSSTGLKYLIVNGYSGSFGNFSQKDVGNYIWALPIDPTSGNVVKDDGTALPNGWSFNDLGATLVGGGFAFFTGTNTNFISDIEIVGDTVYVSVPVARSVDSDPGVWASRALFNNTGKIVDWTPWERVFQSNPSSPIFDQAKYIAVDGQTGQIWQVNNASSGADPVMVNRTTYFIPAAGDGQAVNGGLPGRLQTDLSDGCTAVLDLPMFTPGLWNSSVPENLTNTSNSFALFGGNGKVIFAQPTSGDIYAVTTDFTVATAYKFTTLPTGAGYVRSLGYSRNNTDNTDGYFFAGTDNGLYVYVNPSGAGFNSATGLDNLGATGALNGFAWTQMAATTITGAVIAIEANGTNLFVVEHLPSTIGGFTSKLHQFTIDTTAELTAATDTIIAQSGTDIIPDHAIFTGFTLVTDYDDRTDNFGLLTTNAGIFISESQQPPKTKGPQINTWTAIDSTRAYTLLKAIKRVPTGGQGDGVMHGATVCAFASAGNNFWENSSLFNTGLTAPITSTNNVMLPYNSAVKAATPNLLGGTSARYLDFVTSFWTDGARRIEMNIGSLPYFTSEWNMTTPYDIVDTYGLTGFNSVFWLENISGLGLLMAGTDTGFIVLGLQGPFSQIAID